MAGYTIGMRTIALSAMAIASVPKSAAPGADDAFAKDAAALRQTGSVFLSSGDQTAKDNNTLFVYPWSNY